MSGSQSYYEGLAAQDAVQYGVPQQLFIDQINAESGFNPNPNTGVPNGGIAQFISTTAAQFGLNDPASNPEQSLADAAQYDAQLYQKDNYSWQAALQSYGTTANGNAPALNTEAAAYDQSNTGGQSINPATGLYYTPANTTAEPTTLGPIAAIANFFNNLESYVLDGMIIIVGVVLVAGALSMLGKSQLSAPNIVGRFT